MIKKTCIICKKMFKVHKYRKTTASYCSFKCYWKSLKGRKLSKETCKKLSDSAMGHKAWNKGKKCPQISKGLRGRKLSPKHIKQISEGRMGSKHWNWKGGKYKSADGYIYIYIPSHPFCTKSGYVKQSRLVIEKHLGRYLKPDERVHHKGEKDDDRFQMLRLFPNESKHQKLHALTNPTLAKGHPPNQTSFKKGHIPYNKSNLISLLVN